MLRRGGRLLCLEFSQVSLPLLRQVYDAYSFNVIPKIGGLVAHDEASYQYLVESIRQFPDQVGRAAFVSICLAAAGGSCKCAAQGHRLHLAHGVCSIMLAIQGCHAAAACTRLW